MVVCIHPDCTKRPVYGTHWKKPTHCAQHKTPEMKDVKNKRCEAKDCKILASYGLVWTSRTHCGKHKKPNMTLTIRPKCETKNCEQYAFYSVNDIPVACPEHKTPDQTDIIRNHCDVCFEPFIPNKNINRCNTCKNKWKNGQVKEYDVISYVLNGNFNYIHNKTVRPENKICDSSGCRPDLIVDVKNDLFKVVIEIDENQHTGYKKLCETSVHKELSRLITIHENDFGGYPVIIIRFNPDKYKPKYGLPANMIKRFNVLKQLLIDLKNKKTVQHKLSCYYLFYDGFDKIINSPIKYTIVNGDLNIKHKHPKYINESYIIKL